MTWFSAYQSPIKFVRLFKISVALGTRLPRIILHGNFANPMPNIPKNHPYSLNFSAKKKSEVFALHRGDFLQGSFAIRIWHIGGPWQRVKDAAPHSTPRTHQPNSDFYVKGVKHSFLPTYGD